ncbi:regulator of G-protein signaling 13-like isoform X2 [Xenia sp. Carnegie-2017]|uniref:regulator of G-protein signaling 13-like isoform X2 n=1 Tax=Xenia sp. Carnegie-2017 TaxID=2897299 RepID=UPI001F0367C5|nr:regulator of G-protein signaling 13-like isoform X2 [Xenia sp. Carnegie-2017]
MSCTRVKRISSQPKHRFWKNLWTLNFSANKQVAAGTFRPTSLEARQWATNFDALLADEYGLLIFEDFLKSQHCSENLSFWLDVEKYKKLKGEMRNFEARRIYESYISDKSPTEISIDSRARTSVEARMDQPNRDTFEEAQQQIYYLMKRDCLPRFLKSKQYQQLRCL